MYHLIVYIVYILYASNIFIQLQIKFSVVICFYVMYILFLYKHKHFELIFCYDAVVVICL